ncbi:MAG: type IV pilus assembly protein PilM [Planctomycetota bacterium]|jgi:type IV pilus assembly protein PilM
MKWGWKQSFRREHNELLGLDIGSSKVKLVQLRKEGTGYVVTAAGVVDIEGCENSGKARQANTPKAIRECLKMAGTRTMMAVCGVSGPEVAVRYFEFPSLPPEEIEGAVLLEASQVCPFNVNESTVDYQLVTKGGVNVSGVLVAATQGLIRVKRRFAENASLKCVLMDVDGLALLNCFSGFEIGPDSQIDRAAKYGPHHPRRATAILNVGNSHTTLAIVGDNGLPSIRDIACAGNNIMEHIAAECGVSMDHVRRVLSAADNMESEPKIADSLPNACGKLIDDVAGTLRYYMAQEKSAVVEKVLVCGGFALVNGFVELLNVRLPARTVLWNPFENIPCEARGPCRDILADNGPALAVAAGLAMRSI